MKFVFSFKSEQNVHSMKVNAIYIWHILYYQSQYCVYAVKIYGDCFYKHGTIWACLYMIYS